MANKLRQIFEKKSKLFIPFIVAGDPDLKTTEDILLALADNGSDIIEIGLPFSEPVADGVTIQLATERALKHQVNLQHVFEIVRNFKQQRPDVGIVLYSYLNPIFTMGYDAFAKAAVHAGIDGALVVDLPPEEADDYLQVMKTHNLGTIFLCSPTTSDERIQLIDQVTTGFVYYVSREGVTGARDDLPQSVVENLAKIRTQIKQPLAVGFGVSNQEQAVRLAPHADAVVVGSALVKLSEVHGKDCAAKIGELTKAIAGFKRQFGGDAPAKTKTG